MILMALPPFDHYEAVMKLGESHHNNNNVDGARCGENSDLILHHVSALRPQRNRLRLPTSQWQRMLSMTDFEHALGEGEALDHPGPIPQLDAKRGRTRAAPRQPRPTGNDHATLEENPEFTEPETRTPFFWI